MSVADDIGLHGRALRAIAQVSRIPHEAAVPASGVNTPGTASGSALAPATPGGPLRDGARRGVALAGLASTKRVWGAFRGRQGNVQSIIPTSALPGRKAVAAGTVAGAP